MKWIEAACYLLAVLGVILTAIGRRIIIREAMQISNGWLWAIRLLPLADIMFLARFWEYAKGGAFLSMAGLACLLPLGGKTLWEHSNPKAEDFAAMGAALGTDEKSGIYMEIKAEHAARIEARQRKLTQLNAHMAAWYASMNERRTALAEATPEQLVQFNAEADAYRSLHDVTKKEAAELQTMLNRKLDRWGDITNEDYGHYLAGRGQRASASVK